MGRAQQVASELARHGLRCGEPAPEGSPRNIALYEIWLAMPYLQRPSWNYFCQIARTTRKETPDAD